MNEKIEVLITMPFPEDLISEVQAVSPRLNVTARHARKAQEIPAELWDSVEVLYTNHVLPDPETAANLRWIQFHWAGVDSLVDAPILQKADLVATTLSGAAASQMAEFVLTMLLALGHNLPDIAALQGRRQWPEGRWKRLKPLELRGSIVGIVGYGSVGRQVANLVHRFGALVLATKRDAKHPEDSGYTPEGLGDPGGDLVHRLYPPQALRAMLKECDFVVVAVPLTAETRHLIGADELAALKPTAYLIDVSRGHVIDQDALLHALREKRFAGAALDVFPEEPLPRESPLWELENVIISPHIAGVSEHYDRRAIALFIENLHRYLGGQPLFNHFDLERGY